MPDTLLYSDGTNVWRYVDSGQSGLSDGKWDWIGPVATGLGTAIAGYWVAKTQSKYGQQQQQPQYLGSQPDASSGQFIKGVDNSVLMIGAIGALLLFMMPPGKK